MKKKIEFTAELEFIGQVNEYKDCLMAQDRTHDKPETLWFNIDVLKGHGFAPGDKVRVTVEKIE
jgi:hypothetical protein